MTDNVNEESSLAGGVGRGPWHFDKSRPDLEQAAIPWFQPIATQKCGHSVARQGRDGRFLFTKKSLSLKNVGN